MVCEFYLNKKIGGPITTYCLIMGKANRVICATVRDK